MRDCTRYCFPAVSTRVSGHLDDATFRRLSGEGLTTRAAEAILIVTTDEHGRPHPALLAYGEVLAVTPALVRLAMAATSTTARNLAARGAVTLCLLSAAEGATYVKADARALPPEPALAAEGLSAYEARVQDVLADAPAAGENARLTSGITFASSDAAGQASRGAARLEALRRA
jgi:hypothetical protein